MNKENLERVMRNVEGNKEYLLKGKWHEIVHWRLNIPTAAVREEALEKLFVAPSGFRIFHYKLQQIV